MKRAFWSLLLGCVLSTHPAVGQQQTNFTAGLQPVLAGFPDAPGFRAQNFGSVAASSVLDDVTLFDTMNDDHPSAAVVHAVARTADSMGEVHGLNTSMQIGGWVTQFGVTIQNLSQIVGSATAIPGWGSSWFELTHSGRVGGLYRPIAPANPVFIDPTWVVPGSLRGQASISVSGDNIPGTEMEIEIRGTHLRLNATTQEWTGFFERRDPVTLLVTTVNLGSIDPITGIAYTSPPPYVEFDIDLCQEFPIRSRFKSADSGSSPDGKSRVVSIWIDCSVSGKYVEGVLSGFTGCAGN